MDHVVRIRMQTNALRSGGLLQNLGAFLLELGRTTMSLRMGHNPTDAVVNVGPAVFISTSGPNPIMVQMALRKPGLIALFDVDGTLTAASNESKRVGSGQNDHLFIFIQPANLAANAKAVFTCQCHYMVVFIQPANHVNIYSGEDHGTSSRLSSSNGDYIRKRCTQGDCGQGGY